MQGRNEVWLKVGRVTSFGLTMGAAMFVCGGIGVAADRQLNTTPVLTVILFLSGGACAFWYGIVKILR